jgi:cytochrome P450
MKIPRNVAGKEFIQHKYEYFDWLRENEPVFMGKMFVMNVACLSRYEDCANMLRDERFIRNRSVATGGGGRLPFPLPKSVSPLIQSMINADNPEHRRLRLLVNKAFTPRSLKTMEGQIETLTNQLLDEAEQQGTVDLMQAYALPIPVKVISQLMGVSDEDMPEFRKGVRVLTEGMSGFGIARTLVWDLPQVVKFSRGMVERKRADPGDDVLSMLINAEEEGDKLNEDELIAMMFLLIFAGYETTVHLITNAVLTLLQHPEELEKLRSNPELADGAVEEVLRFRGPVHGTKPNWAKEDVEMHGVLIKRGTPVMPLLGAANRDPRVFENPEVFDIERSPNKHLAFGYGIHLCLGAWLARLETRVALNTLLRRNPNLRMAVPESSLKLQNLPFWHRYESLPVSLR